MLIDFFTHLRRHQLPCSLRELLDLHGALAARLASLDMDEFYQLARCLLVKDEAHYDRFDRAFAEYYEGLAAIPLLPESLPDEWLRKEFERLLSAEEKALLQSLGGLDQLLATLNQRLNEQKERHAGGNKWVGTGGSSPFGHGGFHPEGVRMGERASMARRSRCGRRVIIATSATIPLWDNGPSSWRCANSGAGYVRATRTSWISTTPSGARPDRAGLM